MEKILENLRYSLKCKERLNSSYVSDKYRKINNWLVFEIVHYLFFEFSKLVNYLLDKIAVHLLIAERMYEEYKKVDRHEYRSIVCIKICKPHNIFWEFANL